MAKFSLSWDAHKQNICTGLTALQQNGEFVDMTIAADGHHVKVHQMIMSLASPYLKDIIKSIECTHPVIFLNKVSYPILCAILEYIYTGEVLVDKDNLSGLLAAAKELHIQGLKDMKLELSLDHSVNQIQGQALSDKAYTSIRNTSPENHHSIDDNNDDNLADDTFIENDSKNDDNVLSDGMDLDNSKSGYNYTPKATGKSTETRIQYTISNQGALQMVLNRYLYYLRYTSRKGPNDGHRQWKCISYVKNATKCPATVITQDDIVVKRIGAHNHPFHDKEILKKVRDNKIYTAITEAEALGKTMKDERNKLPNQKL